MDVRLGRLRRGELIAAAGGLALLGSLALAWYRLGGPVGTAARTLGSPVPSWSGWQSLGAIRLVLALAAAMALLHALLALTQRSSALPVAASVLTTVLGFAATVLVLFRIIDHPTPYETLRAGAYVGLAGALGVLVGGWEAMRDEHADPALGTVPVRTVSLSGEVIDGGDHKADADVPAVQADAAAAPHPLETHP